MNQPIAHQPSPLSRTRPGRRDGELFGPYRLEGLVASGGMGEVYRAFDTVRQRMVALKRLPTALAEDSYFRARFRVESASAARLNEPHVIPIHDFGEIDGRLFIDMRLVEGANLAAQLAENGPLAPERAVDIIAQVAAALDAAHRAGLVHRDIKPENVLIVTRSSRTVAGADPLASAHGADEDAADFVYVGDFGIAQAAAVSAQIALTPTGAILGTVYYIAPERLLRGHGDHRVDVYALGCMLYESLTGEKPFPVHHVEQCYAHINAPPPRPSRHPGVPAGLDAVVARAMAKNPNHRFASAGALAAAARAALTSSATSNDTAPLIPTTGSASRMSRSARTVSGPAPRVRPSPSAPLTPTLPAALPSGAMNTPLPLPRMVAGRYGMRSWPTVAALVVLFAVVGLGALGIALPMKLPQALAAAGAPTSGAKGHLPDRPGQPSTSALEDLVRGYYVLLPERMERAWESLAEPARQAAGGQEIPRLRHRAAPVGFAEDPTASD